MLMKHHGVHPKMNLASRLERRIICARLSIDRPDTRSLDLIIIETCTALLETFLSGQL